jgi:heme exporter protein B
MFINLLYIYYIINVIQYKVIINLAFYLLIIIIFILGLRVNTIITFEIHLSLLLINLFLSFIFSIENIFHKDLEEGSLDLYFLMNLPLEILIFFKFIIHWLIYAFPFLCIIPFLGILMNIKNNDYIYFNLFFNTFYLNSLGFIMSSFILGLKQRIFILYLIIFPFFTPCIIFTNIKIEIYIIIILLILLSIITPIMTSHILKNLFK